MQGHRDPNATLYMINMAAPLRAMKEQHIPDTLRANHVYEIKSKQELTLFYHAACFSPTKCTFVDAIKRNAFASWSVLTVELVNKYLPITEANIKGHIRQQYKGTQSTGMQQEVPIMTQQSPPRDPNRANTSTFPQGYRVLQKNLHRSDRVISCHIKSRIQVHHDIL